MVPHRLQIGTGMMEMVAVGLWDFYDIISRQPSGSVCFMQLALLSPKDR